MRIVRIKIRNFRSIKDQDIKINPLFGLIGSNNAGKSNVLKAINLVLGEKFPTLYSVTKKDFYNEDISKDIEIEIFFDESFISYGEECNTVRFRAKHINDTEWETELKAGNSATSIYQEWGLNKEARSKIAIIYIPADRDFARHLEGSSEWSLFGKIKAQLNHLLPNDRRPDLDAKFDEVKSLLEEVREFKNFEEVFKKSFEEYVFSSQHDVNLEIKPFDPKHYYKHLEIVPTEYRIPKNFDQLGDGTKNLLLIALFRAYAEVFGNSGIFLIEEPELYLHPQGRADLFNVFNSLVEKGSQVIYTTHSPELVDVWHLNSIGVVKKIASGNERYTNVLQINEEEFKNKWISVTGAENATIESIQLFLKNLSNAETNKGFFAEKIVLVEGNTEKWALEEYAKKAPKIIDLEKENIEIISTSGKSNIDKFYIMFNAFKYPLYVIFDGDKKDKKANTEEINSRLLRLLGDGGYAFPETKINNTFTIFEDNFETELKKEISNYDKLKEEAKTEYGLLDNRGKEIIGRYIANKSAIPKFVKDIFEKIKETGT